MMTEQGAPAAEAPQEEKEPQWLVEWKRLAHVRDVKVWPVGGDSRDFFKLGWMACIANAPEEPAAEPGQNPAAEAPQGEGYNIDPSAERAFLVYLLERAIKTIYFCIAHDRSKMPAINQAMSGKMPRMGTRFLTPKESCLRFLKEIRTTTKERKNGTTIVEPSEPADGPGPAPEHKDEANPAE